MLWVDDRATVSHLDTLKPLSATTLAVCRVSPPSAGIIARTAERNVKRNICILSYGRLTPSVRFDFSVAGLLTRSGMRAFSPRRTMA